MKTIKVTSLIASALIGLSAHAQNLLLNGSFESPAIPADTRIIGTPTSWAGINRPRILNGNFSVPDAPGPQDGQQYVSIGNDGDQATISQTFAIADPGTYVLTWFDSAGTAPGVTSPYSVTVLEGASVVSNRDLVVSADGTWLSRSMQLNLSSGAYTLRFSSRQPTPGGASTLLDNVSIPVVPEPSTFSLVFVAGLMLVRGITHKR